MNTFFKKINELALPALLAHKKIVVGLSGGPDSVFLLHYLVHVRKKYGIELIAAHLDHGWRKESPEDAAWCAALCRTLNVPFMHAHARDITLKNSSYNAQASELQGRLLRRAFFEKVLHDSDATAIALGHHADDVIETFFIRLVRGTSLSGLAALSLIDGKYLHPLIAITKKEILAWLKDNNHNYLIDATNDSNAYLRNKIRNTVIPQLNTLDERFTQNALKTIDNLKDENAVLDGYTHNIITAITHEKESHKYALDGFNAHPETVQKRVLIKLLILNNIRFTPTTGFLDEVLRFLHTRNGGAHEIAPKKSIVKKTGHFWFEE